MKLNLCDCGLSFLVRLNREVWMRLLPGRRHYFCVRCRTHFLVSRASLRERYLRLPPGLDSLITAPGGLEESRAASAQRPGPARGPSRSTP